MIDEINVDRCTEYDTVIIIDDSIDLEDFININIKPIVKKLVESLLPNYLLYNTIDEDEQKQIFNLCFYSSKVYDFILKKLEDIENNSKDYFLSSLYLTVIHLIMKILYERDRTYLFDFYSDFENHIGAIIHHSYILDDYNFLYFKKVFTDFYHHINKNNQVSSDEDLNLLFYNLHIENTNFISFERSFNNRNFDDISNSKFILIEDLFFSNIYDYSEDGKFYYFLNKSLRKNEIGLNTRNYNEDTGDKYDIIDIFLGIHSQFNFREKSLRSVNNSNHYYCKIQRIKSDIYIKYLTIFEKDLRNYKTELLAGFALKNDSNIRIERNPYRYDFQVEDLCLILNSKLSLYPMFKTLLYDFLLPFCNFHEIDIIMYNELNCDNIYEDLYENMNQELIKKGVKKLYYGE